MKISKIFFYIITSPVTSVCVSNSSVSFWKWLFLWLFCIVKHTRKMIKIKMWLKLKWNDPAIIIYNVQYKRFHLKNCEKKMYEKKSNVFCEIIKKFVNNIWYLSKEIYQITHNASYLFLVTSGLRISIIFILFPQIISWP